MPESLSDPPLFDLRQPLLLGGGLATELESYGHDLRHPLGSAKLIREAPDDGGVAIADEGGARIVGGRCRVSPAELRRIARSLEGV